MKTFARKTLGFLLIMGFTIISLVISSTNQAQAAKKNKPGIIIPPPPPPPAPIRSFTDNFNTNYALEETGAMSESANSNWWLNSGAYFKTENGIAKTNQGNLSADDPWYQEYLSSNPIDTDNGLHPQNIFRLLTKSKWQNLEQKAYFKITNDNLSQSDERYGSNGILLLNRYVDSNNLYYTGLRVDGTAVIKKKINGEYFTLAQTKIFPGIYNRDINPNLLPHNIWLGIKSEISNNIDGSISIKLYLDKDNTGNFVKIFDLKDSGSQFGNRPITEAGFAGIRTDFMDVLFDNYNIFEY